MKNNFRSGFRLGSWRAYPQRNLLVGPQGESHIEPKVMQVLERLADNAGEVVDREQLLQELWAGRAMSDEPLTRCIAALRRVLGDSATRPEYIQTIPKRGYRLVCPVEPLEHTIQEAPQAPRGQVNHRRLRLAVITGLALAAAIYFVFRFLPGDFADSPQVTADGVIAVEPPVHSIAVLPFANLSPDPGNEYLSDGLAAELLNQLTAIPELKVVARTSAFAFKDKDTDVTEIARELRVAHILAGSVRQSGDRLRISAELVDASNGYHVWAHSWNRTFTDIFDIQDEIAASVVASLRVELLNDIPTTERADPEAYKLYLQSTEAFAEQMEPDIGERGIGRFEQAVSLVMQSIAIDPDYAPAWTHLARMQFDLAQWRDGDYAAAYERAISSAERALAVDPAERGALVLLGVIDRQWNWDYESAARWFKKALIASPGHPGTLAAIALMYGVLEHPYPAHLPDVPDADPDDVQSKLNDVFSSILEGRLDDASEQLEDVRKIAPDAIRFRIFEALLAYYEGDYEKAARLAGDAGPDKAKPDEGGSNAALRSCALGKLGRYDEAQAELEKIQRMEESHAYLNVAGVYACRGDNDSAFAWLQRAYEAREYRLGWIFGGGYPLLRSSLSDDPRWGELMQQVGISDEVREKVDRILGESDQQP